MPVSQPLARLDRSLMTTMSLLLVAVLAMGCFLYPMSDPEKSVMDKNLIGMWADAEGTEAMVFLPHDKRTYTMLMMKKKADEKKWKMDDGDMGPGVYKAFITEAKGERYLNIQFMPVALTYNPTQNEKGDLDKIASAAAEANNAGDENDQVAKQRLAIAKQGLVADGIAPAFLIAKISIKGKQMTWQMAKTPDKNDKEYLALKSIDEVRNYILTKSKWDDLTTRTFVNHVQEK